MFDKKKYKGLKITVIILILLLICCGILLPIVSAHYSKVIKAKLPEWISKATNGVYHASVTNVTLSIWHRRIDASGLKLWPDTNRINKLIAEGHPPTTVFTIDIPTIQITQVKLLNILTNKEISCGELVLQSPIAMILSEARLKDSLKEKTPDSLEINKEKKSPAIKVLHADVIKVLSPNVTYLYAGEKDSFYCHMQNGNAVLRDWTFDHNTAKDTSRFLYAASSQVNFGSVSYSSKKMDWRYIAKASSIYFETAHNSLVMKDAIFSASLIKNDPDKGRYLKERDSIHTNTVTLNNFDWKQLMNNKLFTVEVLELGAPVMDCYTNRTPSNKNWVSKYPQQFLQKVKLQIDVHDINIHNGLVRYTELNPKNNLKGVIEFNTVTGGLHNVTNIKSTTPGNDTCVARLHSKFKNKSDVSTIFHFFMGDTTGTFTVDAIIKDIDAAQISKDAAALSLIEIKSVHIPKIDIHLQGNADGCKGQLTLLYNNLEIELKKIAGNKQMKDRPVVSMLANDLFLYPENPTPGKEVRQADMFVERDTKSFFNLIWSTISEGAQKTAIRGEVAKKRVIAAQEGKKKPGIIKRILGSFIKH